MGDELDQRWQDGTELSSAWRVIPDLDLQNQYVASGDNFAHRESVILLMQLELADRLMRGEYRAIGIFSNAGSDPVLSLVPKLFWRPDHIDWGASTVRAYGQVYEDVRIVGWPSLYRIRRGLIDADAASVQVAVSKQIEAAGKASAAAVALKDLRVGRPPTVPLLQEIIRELGGEGRLQATPSHRVNLISRLARERHPDCFRGDNSPAPNTVRKALRAEGYDTSREQKVQKPSGKNAPSF